MDNPIRAAGKLPPPEQREAPKQINPSLQAFCRLIREAAALARAAEEQIAGEARQASGEQTL